MTDTTSGALPDLRAGSFTVSPAGGVVNPRDFGITHPAIKKPVTIQITAVLVPA
jgi:hypothetical protein